MKPLGSSRQPLLLPGSAVKASVEESCSLAASRGLSCDREYPPRSGRYQPKTLPGRRVTPTAERRQGAPEALRMGRRGHHALAGSRHGVVCPQCAKLGVASSADLHTIRAVKCHVLADAASALRKPEAFSDRGQVAEFFPACPPHVIFKAAAAGTAFTRGLRPAGWSVRTGL